jgi:hypothetical protein
MPFQHKFNFKKMGRNSTISKVSTGLTQVPINSHHCKHKAYDVHCTCPLEYKVLLDGQTLGDFKFGVYTSVLYKMNMKHWC